MNEYINNMNNLEFFNAVKILLKNKLKYIEKLTEMLELNSNKFQFNKKSFKYFDKLDKNDYYIENNYIILNYNSLKKLRYLLLSDIIDALILIQNEIINKQEMEKLNKLLQNLIDLLFLYIKKDYDNKILKKIKY